MRRSRAALLRAAVLVALGGAAVASAVAADDRGGAPSAVCPRRMVSQPLPPRLRGFPLPAGATVAAVREDVRVVRAAGYLPLGLARAARHFRARLPASGYALTGGDAEPVEVDETFRGHGLRGALKLSSLPGCPGSVAFLLAVAGPPP